MDEQSIRELRLKCEIRLVDLKTKLMKISDPDEIAFVDMAIKYNQDLIMEAADLDKDYFLEN